MPEWVLGGTGVMLNTIETITNKDKFLHYFQTKSGLSESEIWEIFLHIENMYAGKPHKAAKSTIVLFFINFMRKFFKAFL